MKSLPSHPAAATGRADVLRARARDLARPAAGDRHREDERQLVEFVAARQRFAVATAQVREVCRLQDLTPVPCTPSYVCGIVNVRGQILTVLDLRRLLDLPDQGLIDRQHVLIVHADGAELGLLADGTPLVRSVRAADIQPPPPTLAGAGSVYVSGVTADGLAVLDAARLLADPGIVIHQEATAPPRTSQTTGESTS